MSLALITLGVLDVLPGLVLFCARPATYVRRGPVGPQADNAGEQFAAIAGVTFSVLSLPVGALILAAGVALLQRRARIFGVVTANVAMLPFSCWFLAGIPVGIWVMSVLARDDVRALFDPPGPFPSRTVTPPAGPPG